MGDKGVVTNSNGFIRKLRLSTSNSRIKYYVFSVRCDGKSYPVAVHRLQAFQKFGTRMFESGMVVRHLDGNPLNNSVENIEIGTNSDNMMDIPKEVRITKASHPTHVHLMIIEDRKKGYSYSELMGKYNISSKGTISFIIKNSLASKAA